MKKMFVKNPENWLIFLLSMSLCGVVGRYVYKKHQNNAARREVGASIAKKYEEMDMMTQDEYYKVREIGESIKKTHAISDSDLAWWIQLINRPATSKRGQRTAPTRRLVALNRNWRYLTKATPEQKDKLFDLGKTYLSPQPISTKSNQIFGLVLVTYMDDRRAKPYIMPFLNRSPDSGLRRISDKLLKRWEYQSSQSLCSNRAII